MMCGQVKLYGNYRNIAVGQCPFVCVFALILIDELARKPVIFPALRIGSPVEFLHPPRIGLSAYFNAFDVLFFQFWEIDIEHYAFGYAIFQGIDRYGFDVILDGFEIGVPRVIAERKAYGGNSLYSGFYRSAHGTGVNDVHGRIGTVIDAAYADIGFPFQYFVYRKFYTVHRCTGTTVLLGNLVIYVYPVAEQGGIYRNGVSFARLRAVRGNDNNIANFFHDFYKGSYARCGYAVVIGHQYQGSLFHEGLHLICVAKISIFYAHVRFCKAQNRIPVERYIRNPLALLLPYRFAFNKKLVSL